MFQLVEDVDSYSSFLPWCSRSEELSRSDDIVEATLELRKGAMSKAFTTRNTLKTNESIDLELLGGPFRHLAGGWTFKPLGEDGCKVSLELEFEFENKMVDLVFASFFEEACGSLVDSFTRRAAHVFGER